MAPKVKGPVTRPRWLPSLRPRYLWTRRRRWRLLLLAERIEHAAAALPERCTGYLLRGCAGVLDDRPRLAVQTRQDRQHQAGGEYGGGEDRGGAGEHVRSAPARQKPAGRADAEPAACRLLQQ